MKDAYGRYLAGPISDWNGGGRWFSAIPPGGEVIVWALFEPLTVGGKVTVQIPLMFPFDDTLISEGPPASPQQAAGSLPPLKATLISAKRSPGELNVRLKISNPGKTATTSGAIRYVDVSLFDPQSKQKFLLLKDTEGKFQAEPVSDANEGGRWFPSYVRPGGQALMSLTFAPPPDSVHQVDLLIPGFVPFEGVAISGEGGSSGGGVAVSGKSLGLESALKDLNAEVTAQEIKVNLAADLLFDFDEADIKPEAEPALKNVATVLKAYPTSQVEINGYTDGKGAPAYNQALSEKRASAVAQWLVSHGGVNSASLHTKGWGKASPVAPNTKPDGSDNPEGRAKNRRVEIVVKKSG